jgi:exonuclease III
MRIATWDVNSLKARLDKVRWWLDRARPDVLLMQETKLTDAAAPVEVFRDAGYFPISRRRASCSAFETRISWFLMSQKAAKAQMPRQFQEEGVGAFLAEHREGWPP